MNQDGKHMGQAHGTRLVEVSLLCLGGLLINILGVRLALGLKLPLFLDNIGSVLAAALGGYIPGIIVGFLTNLINGISDYTTAYYGSLTVMIAICAALFAKNGWFRSPSKIIAVIVTFALIGGGLGSVLTWMLYGFSFGEGISSPLAHRIYDTGLLSMFWSQFSADMLIDVADKTITVLIVALVLRLMPEEVQKRFYLYGWQQAPLSERSRAAAERKRFRKRSLRFKLVLLVSAATLIIAVVITAISFMHFRDASIEEQTRLAYGVAELAGVTIDADRVDEFIEKGEAAEGYSQIKARLGNIMNSSKDIEYVYAYRILPEGCQVVFDPDTEDTPGMKAGEMVEFDDAFRPYLPELLTGQPIKPIISDGKYGWLLTVYRPVYDSKGVCQCYAAVDISMDQIALSGYRFLARVISLFLGFFILILAVSIWLAEYNVILPINTISMASERFAYNSEEARADTVERIKRLDIHTGDEIENLYHAVTKTTEDTVRYITDVQQQGEVIAKLQNGLILVLADMVESRDKCTGDHVRKTAAYARVIMEQLRREGVYTDQLTDAFVEDVVNSAPLHDVGKIEVSDALLNKPGRLTDEEFEQMKRHTTAGSEIIERAIDMVSEEQSGYLKEARNLAAYHHEKWNGKGYPCGLATADIPLSARIMAVADVFDALVSKRSYKEGFPFEKAMEIIKEGSGTHFDPNVAGAFIHAEDEVRRIATMHMDVRG